MPRPLKPIDGETIYKLALLGCSYREMGAICGVDHTTIARRFATEKELGESRGNMALRRRQMKRALEGSDTMLIHLGKQRLGQTDRLDVKSDGEALKGGPTFVMYGNGRGPTDGAISRIPSTNGTDPVPHNGS